MWAAIKSFWLNGWTEAAAGNSVTVTQPTPAIGGSGGVRISGTGATAQPPPTIAAVGTVSGGIAPVPVWPTVPVIVTFEPRPRPQHIVGNASIVAPPPVIRATGTVGVSAAEDDLETLLLLGVIDFEEYLILLDDLAA